MTKESNGAIVRVVKSNNFTIISNGILKNKNLSFKAKGLMCVCLSLPDGWAYSISGLKSLSTDGRVSIEGAIKELKKYGYLVVTKERTEKGNFQFIYTFYENPLGEGVLSEVENQLRVIDCGKSTADNQQLLNTKDKENKSSTKKDNNKPEKKTYGQFLNVFLTDEHIEKLLNIYGTEDLKNKAIEILSSYKESAGKKYKNDFAVLNEFNWVYKKVFPNGKPNQSKVINISSGNPGKYAGYHKKQENQGGF